MLKFDDPENDDAQYALDLDDLSILHTDDGTEWWDLNANGEPCETEDDLAELIATAPIPRPLQQKMLYELDMKLNDHDVVVREDRDGTKTASGSYYHCNTCGHDNTDISDVTEEPCWKCGGRNLEYRSFT